MSGGWQLTFSVTTSGPYDLTLRYDLTQTRDYESDELSQVMVSIAGTPIAGLGPDYLVELAGNGNGGSPLTTGWRTAWDCKASRPRRARGCTQSPAGSGSCSTT